MDNAIGLGIILSLRDRASAGLEAVRNRLTALRDVSQDMLKQFDAGAKQLIAGVASMAAGVKVFGMMTNLFGVPVKVAADFEQAMARVGAVSGAVGEDFEKLTKQTGPRFGTRHPVLGLTGCQRSGVASSRRLHNQRDYLSNA